MPNPATDARTSWRSLATLFFFTAMPMGMWMVPLANVFATHGKAHLIPWVLSTSAIAAFTSPLFVGALADQRISPTLLLRWLTLGSSCAVALTATSLELGWSDVWILLCAQIQSLIVTPVWSVANSIILAGLKDPKKQFGPLRAWATGGWMVGCWIISLIQADASVLAAYTAATLWLVVMATTWRLPMIAPGDLQTHRSWKQILGLDALSLLSHRDHRVVFITAALFTVPLAAFYPYTARHLHEMQVDHVSAWISIGQITEVIAMMMLAGLLARFRLKWIFLAAIAICTVRYSFNAQDRFSWLLLGTFLHGFAYTLYFITTQIYLEERVDPKWRVRAQALLSLLTGGVGNLLGYLGGGWWHAYCQHDGRTDWSLFWWGETALTAAVCIFFALAYRGRHAEVVARAEAAATAQLHVEEKRE